MIATLEQIKLIRDGELTELHVRVERPPRKGALRAIQSRPGKRASCHVRILGSRPHQGGYVVRFELASDEFPALMLDQKGGYTTNPGRAMKDRTSDHWDPVLGPPPEPQALDRDVLEAYAKENRERFKLSKGDDHDRRELRSRLERLRHAAAVARRRGFDTSTHMKAIDRQIADLERALRDRAA